MPILREVRIRLLVPYLLHPLPLLRLLLAFLLPDLLEVDVRGVEGDIVRSCLYATHFEELA